MCVKVKVKVAYKGGMIARAIKQGIRASGSNLKMSEFKIDFNLFYALMAYKTITSHPPIMKDEIGNFKTENYICLF